MNINQIIFRGPFASGKTYTAETIANIFDKGKVLRIDSGCETAVGISRKILKSNFELIIFDEVLDLKHIKHLQKHVLNYIPEDKLSSLKAVIYLTQNEKLKEVLGCRILECRFK